jgi:transposase
VPGLRALRPDLLLADRGYSFPSCRKLLRSRNIRHVIPERTDQRRRRTLRLGRKPKFNREAYTQRNVVERCVNKLKQWRSIATHYDKRASNYMATIVVVALHIYLIAGSVRHGLLR